MSLEECNTSNGQVTDGAEEYDGVEGRQLMTNDKEAHSFEPDGDSNDTEHMFQDWDIDDDLFRTMFTTGENGSSQTPAIGSQVDQVPQETNEGEQANEGAEEGEQANEGAEEGEQANEEANEGGEGYYGYQSNTDEWEAGPSTGRKRRRSSESGMNAKERAYATRFALIKKRRNEQKYEQSVLVQVCTSAGIQVPNARKPRSESDVPLKHLTDAERKAKKAKQERESQLHKVNYMISLYTAYLQHMGLTYQEDPGEGASETETYLKRKAYQAELRSVSGLFNDQDVVWRE